MDSVSCRTMVLAAVLLAAVGCAARGGGEGSSVPKPSGVGWYLKKVVAKEPPDMLMATDATVCRVPASQFRAVMTGTSVRCNWQ